MDYERPIPGIRVRAFAAWRPVYEIIKLNPTTAKVRFRTGVQEYTQTYPYIEFLLTAEGVAAVANPDFVARVRETHTRFPVDQLPAPHTR